MFTPSGTSSFSPHGDDGDDGDGGALRALGWDEAFADAFAGHRSAGLMPARVVRVDRGVATVVTAAGEVRVSWPKHLLAPPSMAPAAVPQSPPCTGDWAAVRPGTRSGERPDMVGLLPRRTAITRSSVSGDSRAQVLAANVDTVAIAVSLAARAPAGRVERMLAVAWDSGALPVIVLTKADRATGDPARARDEVAALAPGVDVLVTSAVTGEGMDTLPAVLAGTVVLLGASGAGKSTLGNALLGRDVLATGGVREQDGRGRHTTVHRELLPLPGGGVLIDTPGLRAIGLQKAEAGLQQVFAEIEELAQGCRFGDCNHLTEPGCAVLAAIDDGRLPERRLDSYRRLLRESAWAASRDDARLRSERENQRKAITRHLRATYDHRGRRS